MSLELQYSKQIFEAGLDEAGRGCLAGPVVAAAVILPQDFSHPDLKDSKVMTHRQRMKLRTIILDAAINWNLGMKSAQCIDEINILQASHEAMHEAIAGMGKKPEFLAIDGNRFKPYPDIPHACIIKGDSKYLNIAAASVLAKTYRDEIMQMLHEKYPWYHWDTNKAIQRKLTNVPLHIMGHLLFTDLPFAGRCLRKNEESQ